MDDRIGLGSGLSPRSGAGSLDRVWSTGGCDSRDAASVRTNERYKAADRDAVRDEEHLEAVSQRRGPRAMHPLPDDPL